MTSSKIKHLMQHKLLGATGAFALAAIGSSAAAAQGPAFARIFGDHAVLQRGLPIATWGTAPPAAIVSVSLGRETVQVTASSSGKWVPSCLPWRRADLTR